MAAVMAPRSTGAMVDRAAVPAVSLGRRQVLARLVRVTMVVLLALMRLRIAELVVVALLPLDRTAMQAVGRAVLVTPTTVRHTLAAAAAAIQLLVALQAVAASVVPVVKASPRLATLVQLALDLVVAVPAALASERPRLRVAQAAMALL